MSITKVDRKFEKGLAIIVGNKPDGVLVHVAKVLGKEIQFLDIAHISSCDELIYLVGHGNKKKYTIDDVCMLDIAKKLKNANYQGQTIYITACDYLLSHNGKSIHSCLEDAMTKIGLIPNIESDVDGKSIILETDGNIEMHIVREDEKTSHLKIVLEKDRQAIFDRLNKSHINMSMFMDDKALAKVDSFKRKLISSFKK